MAQNERDGIVCEVNATADLFGSTLFEAPLMHVSQSARLSELRLPSITLVSTGMMWLFQRLLAFSKSQNLKKNPFQIPAISEIKSVLTCIP